jgi:rfaE bifunctional protein nucleotidyltransferase chain/domain
MAIAKGIFGNGSSFDVRFVPDYHKLTTIVEALKSVGLVVVLTSGSFDWLHTGHYNYLERAKEFGDVLVVGVDSTEKLKKKKGPRRPVIPEKERLESLIHTRHVDLLTVKQLSDKKWALIEAVHPDVLIATEGVYSPEEILDLETNYCGKVVVLAYTETVSTTAKLRDMYMQTGSAIAPVLMNEILALITEHSPTLIERALDKADHPRETAKDAKHDD